MGLVVSEKKIFLVFPIVSLWDLSVAMETTILIQSAQKPNAINLPTQLWFTLNLIKISLLASEIFFFEIVDGRRRRTTDACLSYKLTCEPSAQVSELKTLNKKHLKHCNEMSHVMRKPDFCLWENKGTDLLCSNCAVTVQ